ncbi:MAG TPA: hypothetical protein VFE94_03420 [Candidatus Paceibacterota bacterium]|nr:hypothetical protein [Candidatus Paceibacterota bacterium]
MKSYSTIISVAVWAGLLIAAGAYAAQTGVVSATVTAQNISVAVQDASIAYGSLALSASYSTLAAEANDLQFASNIGNLTEDFNIQGADTASWTLESAIGSEQYTHEFSTNRGTVWVKLSTSYQQLVDAVAQNVSQQFDLQITVPSGTSDFTQQTAAVTVQAVAD